MSKANLQVLIDMAISGLIIPAQWGAARDSAKAEWVTRDGLPLVHFSWLADHWMWDLTEVQAKTLEGVGFKIEKAKEGTLSTTGIATKTSHIWLCNFRRYGWSWSSGRDGESGYGYGVTYANSELPIAFIADTEELVIRDCLIATWAKLLGGDLPGFFNTSEVHVLLRDLLSDAMKNVSQHATPWQRRARYMGPVDSKGFFIPVTRSPEMEKEFPMPTTKKNNWGLSFEARDA